MKYNKLAVLSVLFFLSSAGLVGCNKTSSNSKSHVSGTKAVINIGTYNGGVGSEWIRKICDRFNEEFADYQDEQMAKLGLKGVEFNIEANANYEGSKMEQGLICDIYFTEAVDYAYLANKGLFLDVTDVVEEETLEEFGDTGTIADKLDVSMQDYLTCIDDKYYGLPFYEGFYNLIYDVDVFDDLGLFFDRDGVIGETSDSDNLSTGPDGEYGTWDDGLPRTYAEFDALIAAAEGTYTPIGLAGNATNYINAYIQNYYVNYEGKEQSDLNYNFSGTATDLGTASYDASGKIVFVKDNEPTVISDFSNGYQLQRQGGKLYALDFLKNHLLNTGRISVAKEHKTAQADFINSKYGKSSKTYSYAMLVEGSWWENEAKAALETDAATHPGTGGKMNRRFGILPLPKASMDQVGQKQTVTSLNASYALVAANTTYPELAKKVFKYFHTNASLSSFTATTSMTRAFDYTLTESDEAETSYFCKQLMEMKSSCDIVYPYSGNSNVINRPSYFRATTYPWAISLTSSHVYNTFTQGGSYSDPVSYFNQMYKYASTTWNK